MDVAVKVGLGVGERVGSGTSVGDSVGMIVIEDCVAASFAAFTVNAMTVGK